MKKFILPILILGSIHAGAEVFSLWPFGSSKALSDDALLNPEELMNEKIVMDGKELNLSIATVDLPLSVCLEQLRKNFPDALFASNRNSSLVEYSLKNGRKKRIFLLSVNGMSRVMRFSMELPENGVNPGDWPNEFPLLPGAKVLSVMRFPGRNAVYGSFSVPMERGPVLSQLSAALRSEGWNAASGEYADPFKGSGEIFIKNNKMLIIGITVANGVSTVSLYTK